MSERILRGRTSPRIKKMLWERAQSNQPGDGSPLRGLAGQSGSLSGNSIPLSPDEVNAENKTIAAFHEVISCVGTIAKTSEASQLDSDISKLSDAIKRFDSTLAYRLMKRGEEGAYAATKLNTAKDTSGYKYVVEKQKVADLRTSIDDAIRLLEKEDADNARIRKELAEPATPDTPAEVVADAVQAAKKEGVFLKEQKNEMVPGNQSGIATVDNGKGNPNTVYRDMYGLYDEQHMGLMQEPYDGTLEGLMAAYDKLQQGFNACREMGVEPKFREWDGIGSLVNFVVSLNLKRRQLSASQRAVVAMEILPMVEAEAKAKERQRNAGGNHGNQHTGGKVAVVAGIPQLAEPDRSRDQAAELTGVSPRYIQEVKAIAKDAPEKIKEIQEGKTTVNKEYGALKKVESKEERRDLTKNPYSNALQFSTIAISQLTRIREVACYLFALYFWSRS